MKNSNKILLTSILAILVIVTGLIISSRIMIKNIPNRPTKYSDEEIVTKVLDLKDFESIETKGVWLLEIVQGNEFSVSIEYPESEAGEIDVDTWNSCLQLENDLEWNRRRSPFRAKVTMPNLKSIRTENGASIEIQDFTCEELDVRIKGAAEIDAQNLKITNLTLRCDGASDANFKNSGVFNATIDVNGASRIVLRMTGGRLSGSAHGASSIVYYGDVSSKNFSTAGAASVQHRKN